MDLIDLYVWPSRSINALRSAMPKHIVPRSHTMELLMAKAKEPVSSKMHSPLLSNLVII